MPATYEPIATTTLGTAAASITFSSITSAYTDLRVLFIPTGTATQDLLVRFNSDTASNYSSTTLIGNGTSALSFRSTSSTSFLIDQGMPGISTTSPTMYDLNLFSYAGSTFKTVLNRTSADLNGSGQLCANVGLWRSTSAITAIEFRTASTTFAAGTTATLYGIKNA
jgi:hypothetical protein